MPDRAILFIDGNNWYHSLRDEGIRNLGRLDYRRISERLVGIRTWLGTRYYIGRMSQQWNRPDYAAQRAFLAKLVQDDPSHITTHLGRLERRTEHNEAAGALLRYLASLPIRIDRNVFQRLLALGHEHRRVEVVVEKAVDVMIAVDMVVMAQRDKYDAAYLLSADGDFTPAVDAVQKLGKKVYVASPQHGAQLARVCTAFIRLDAGWFRGCYRR